MYADDHQLLVKEESAKGVAQKLNELVLASWTIGDLTVILNNCLKSIHTGPQIRFLESQECKRFFWGIDLPKYCNIFI